MRENGFIKICFYLRMKKIKGEDDEKRNMTVSSREIAFQNSSENFNAMQGFSFKFSFPLESYFPKRIRFNFSRCVAFILTFNESDVTFVAHLSRERVGGKL